MSDPLAGLPAPRAVHGMGWDGMSPLVVEDNTIDDSEQIRKILNEELEYLSGDVLKLMVAKHYNIPDGSPVIIDPNWPRQKADGKFPIAGIVDKTTEIGFRRSVRAMVNGLAEDIVFRQFKGKWCLVDFEVVKMLDGDATLGISNGVVTRQRDVFLTEGMGSNTRIDPRTGIPIPDYKGKKERRRTVFRLNLTFVDITGSDEVIYREGRPDDGTWAAQKQQTTNLDKLLQGIMQLAGQNVQQQAPVTAVAAPAVRPDPEDGVKALAAQYGISVDAMKAMLSSIVEQAEEDAQEHDEDDGESRFFLDDDGVLMWRCPLCDYVGKALPSSLGIHLKKHAKEGRLTEAYKKSLMAELSAYFAANGYDHLGRPTK
jgi:hypothetical protein